MTTKKYIFIVLGLLLIIILINLSKRRRIEQPEGPVSMSELERLIDNNLPLAEEEQESLSAPASEAELKPKTAVSAKPPILTNRQIQKALKKAGYYHGKIDGKIGPMTKKAVQDFQKANNLKVDGKVGPQTTSALSKYLPKQ